MSCHKTAFLDKATALRRVAHSSNAAYRKPIYCVACDAWHLVASKTPYHRNYELAVRRDGKSHNYELAVIRPRTP